MCEATAEKRDERNIMIMFLSNLHGEWLKQRDKVTGKEKRTTIMQDDKLEQPYKICRPEEAWCKETNEAPMADVLSSLGKPLDAIFYFSTNQVGMYPPPEGRALGKHITVLFPPAFNIPKEYDSEAHFFWTERAPKVLGDKFMEKTKLFPVAFDESASDPIQSTLLSVKAMEDAIRDYLQEENVLEQGDKPLRHCHLYVDVTGGIRTANMAMSAVMQLLVYQDAKLERVVYSDLQTCKVSNVQPINDMYKLVAGVDAFTKYGSSAALNEYFSDVINDRIGYPPLKKMLFVMDKFSASVLLCQTDLIKKNLAKLMRRLYKFMKEESGDRPAKVELFTRMTKELVHRYSKMLPDMAKEPDEIEIIQWCVDNSLIQQALTLCTEWLPEYLVNHGAVYTEDQSIQHYCQTKSGRDGDSVGKKHFLMDFCTQKNPEIGKITDWPITENCYAIVEGKAPVQDDKGYVQKFAQRLRDVIAAIPREMHSLRAGKHANNPDLAKIMDKIRQSNNKIASNDLSKEILLKRLKSWKRKDYTQVFGQEDPPLRYIFPEPDKEKADESAKIRWDDRVSRTAVAVSRNMLACGMMCSDISKEDALEYIRGYTYIRADLRNKFNHAKGDAALQKVQKDIDEYLKLLRKIRDRKHIYSGLWAEDASKETHHDRFRFCQFLESPSRPMV